MMTLFGFASAANARGTKAKRQTSAHSDNLSFIETPPAKYLFEKPVYFFEENAKRRI
jgi:hypothetical protein